MPVPTLTRSGAPVVGPAGTGRPGEGVNVQKLSLRVPAAARSGPLLAGLAEAVDMRKRLPLDQQISKR